MIYTQPTPNPLALKFILNQDVVSEGEYLFSSPQEAQPFPVLEHILSLPGVETVLAAKDFLTVNKGEQVTWPLLEGVILSILHHHEKDFPLDLQDKQFIKTGDDLLDEGRWIDWMPSGDDVRLLCKEIEELLDTYVRPVLAQDGGSIRLVAFDDGIVYLQFQGACQTCPQSEQTLHEGVRRTLCYYIPEVRDVKAIY